MSQHTSAIIICTRDRPSDLLQTLDSIADQRVKEALLLIIVDCSTDEKAQQNRSVVSKLKLATLYLSYPDKPSLARQRNYGAHHLPESVKFVFFLDDDVTLCPGYFENILELFYSRPQLGGIGGRIVPPTASSAENQILLLLKYIFLIDHPRAGRILLSGHASSPSKSNSQRPQEVDWLHGGASAFRRSLLEEIRFDPHLVGYSLFEDRDFSFRASRHTALATCPKATLIHRKSLTNRFDAAKFGYERVIHRYWFLEKNIRHPLRKPAFWWATLGQTLALLTSSKPERWEALRGHLKGIWTVLRRAHPLLQPSSSSKDHGSAAQD